MAPLDLTDGSWYTFSQTTLSLIVFQVQDQESLNLQGAQKNQKRFPHCQWSLLEDARAWQGGRKLRCPKRADMTSN